MELLMHDRNIIWRSISGDKKIKDMDDTHVVNIVHLLETSRLPYLYNKLKEATQDYAIEYMTEVIAEQKIVLNNFTEEIKYTCLPESMLDNAPYPFRDKDGKIYSRPLEDQAPFLDRDELKELMYISLTEESKK